MTMFVPRMSAGIRSGVNWMRLKDRSSTSLSVRTSKRFAETGHAFEQHMPAGENGDERAIDDFSVPDDDLADFVAQRGETLAEGGDLRFSAHEREQMNTDGKGFQLRARV